MKPLLVAGLRLKQYGKKKKKKRNQVVRETGKV